jgi:transposase-like protein
VTTIYPPELREHLVARMLGDEGRSASSLSRETGIPQTTLSRWKLSARSVASMTTGSDAAGGAPPRRPRRPQDWTAAERLQAVIEASTLADAELGAWLRREGLHEATLAQWREAALRGLGATGAPGEAKRVKELERELRRKDKALAETAALLVLQGKVQALWEEEGGNTTRR